MLTITGKRLSTRIKHDLAVVVNGKQLENVRCAKLLGLKIDHELTLIPHVEKLCKTALAADIPDFFFFFSGFNFTTA